MTLTTEERITRSKVQMYSRSPFFSYIISHMKIQEDVKNMLRCPTMGVDTKKNIYYNKEFIDKLSDDEIMGVFCHETLHLGLLHLERTLNKEQMLFNIANDLVVNNLLVNEGFKLPAGGLIPSNHSFTFEQIKYTIEKINEKTSEEIYYELYDKFPKQKQSASGIGKDGQSSSGNGSEQDNNGQKLPQGFDEHILGDSKESQSEKESRLREIKKMIAEGASLAKQAGKLPAGLERFIDGILDSKINWKEKLYQYVVAQLPFDYSWSVPSKRGISQKIYLPKVVKESVHIVFHIDTSGSMAVEELQQALGEIQSIMNSFVNVKIDILVGDAEIQNTFQLTTDNKDDIVEIAKGMKGGGGTSHLCIPKFIEENIDDCKLLLCFTDGFSDIDKMEQPPYNIIWLITKNGTEKDIKFGEVVRIGD